MTVRNLDVLFDPEKVRVADDGPESGFLHDAAAGTPVPAPYGPGRVLGIVRGRAAAPAATIARLAAQGVRAVFLEEEAAERWAGRANIDAALIAGRPFVMRLLGPGGAGLALPRAGVYAGVARDAEPMGVGRLAWVSQSGTPARQALRFVATRDLGLSLAVALGDEVDVDCGDVLDYLASDPHTTGVVVAIERVKSARKFMSAARACVRNKPVVVWCAPAPGEDRLAYDAAIRRAGFVRVPTIDALLDALATLQSGDVSSSDVIRAYQAGRERLSQTPPSLPAHRSELQRARELLDAVVGSAGRARRGDAIELQADDVVRLLGYFDLQVQTAVPLTAPELAVEMRDDPTFGPFLVLGAEACGTSGTAAAGSGTPGDGTSGEPDAARPTASALLPLNAALAHDVLAPLAAAKGWGSRDAGSFADALVSLSALLSSVERVRAFAAVVRVWSDASAVSRATLERVTVRIGAAGTRRALAIRPYPTDLEEQLDWEGHRLTIRPIRPEDEAAHAEFFRALTPNDLRLRFFGIVREPDHAQLARYVQIDYDREMALVVCTCDAGRTVIHGVVRAVTDPDNDYAEFAVTIRSDEKGHHLGRMLMDRIIRYCRRRGTRLLVGDVLRENARMLALARDCGFMVNATDDPTVMSVRMTLNP